MDSVIKVERYNEASEFYQKNVKDYTKERMFNEMKNKFYDFNEDELIEICETAKNNKQKKDTVISIGPNDLSNGRFVCYANRTIKPSFIKKYQSSPDFEEILASSTLHLIQTGSNTYRVLDGQHRIYAIVNNAKINDTEYEIKATIYPICHFATEFDVCNKIKSINSQYVHTSGNKIEIYRNESPWVAVAEQMGMEKYFTFNQSRNSITWLNVLRSFLVFQNSSKRRELNSGAFCQNDKIHDTWLYTSKDEIRQYLSFMNWYYPYNVRAVKTLKISNFSSTQTIATIACIYAENYKHINVDTYMQRLLDHPELPAIRSHDGDYKTLSKFILNKMNYRVINHLIDLYGVTGR